MNQDYFTNSQDATVVSDRVLYTPSAFARTSLLYLQETGSLLACKEHTSHRTGLDSYLFFIVEKGSGTVKYDGLEYALKAGDCVFIDCRRPYSHTTSASDLWSLRWIHFDGQIMPAIYDKYISRGGRSVIIGMEESIDKLEHILEDIAQMASSDDHIRDMRINERLNSLLTILMEKSFDPDEANKRKQRTDLRSIKTFIEENYTETLSLEDLADRFYINKFYLTRIFKSEYGVSINTYIQQLRITKAKQLLRFSDHSIEAVGELCGVGEQNYFSRLFKKVEGISPSTYRQLWKQNG